MSISKSWGFTPTLGTRNTCEGVNFDAVAPQMWGLISETANSRTYAMPGTPLDQPQTVTLQWRDVEDIYKGTQVSPASQITTRKGRVWTIFANLILRCTDSVTGSVVDLPLQSTLSLKTALNTNLTSDDLVTVIGMALAFALGNYRNTGSSGAQDYTTGVANLTRGILGVPPTIA
jgi:hypothetical protein